jgi:GNAT superfamily N-acetyltransferase
MKIRLSSIADNDALLAISHKFFHHNPYRHDSSIDEPSLLKTLEDLRTNHVLLVAEVDGKVVGTAGAYVTPVFWNHNEMQGLEVFWWIDEEHRGDGAGKKLRRQLQVQAKLRGAKFWNMVALEDSMPEAVGAMYESAGFKPIERVYMKVLQ